TVSAFPESGVRAEEWPAARGWHHALGLSRCLRKTPGGDEDFAHSSLAAWSLSTRANPRRHRQAGGPSGDQNSAGIAHSTHQGHADGGGASPARIHTGEALSPLRQRWAVRTDRVHGSRRYGRGDPEIGGTNGPGEHSPTVA